MATNTSSQYVDLDDRYGTIIIKTLNGHNIVCMYNYEKSTIENILNVFYNNYNLDYDNKAYVLNIMSTELGRALTEEDYKKLPSQLGLSELSHFNLELKTKKYVPKHVVIKSDFVPDMQIFIKTLVGAHYSLDVSSSTTVEELKEIIYETVGFPPDQMRLVYASHSLEDDKTLADYNIQKSSVVHVILRLRGGMYHETSGKNGNFKPLTDCVLWIDLL